MNEHILTEIPSGGDGVVREIIFVGTGTSGCVPNVHCLTETPRRCIVCADAYERPNSRNKRLNTSVIVRCNLEPTEEAIDKLGTELSRLDIKRQETKDDKYDDDRTILIDCGKTFYSAALKTFTTHKLRRIDALLLSHGHADAMLGLDDLRQWTMNSAIQSHVDIYLSPETMAFVASVFPYLVDPSKASGGGDVAGLRFHLINPDEPFSLFNGRVTVLPFNVEHGRLNGDPYYSLGFRIDSFVYISDTSYIPPSAMSVISMPPPSVFVLDALHEKPHPSHLSITQALDYLHKIQPRLGLLTGFSHRVDHESLQKDLDDDFEKNGVEIYAAWDLMKVILT